MGSESEFKARAWEAALSPWHGHPPGLLVLFLTELWERFSFYGMGALLVLYLNSGPLMPGRFETLYGSSVIAALFGEPQDADAVQALSSQLWGAYVCFAYVTPVVGGALADSLLGSRATLLYGGVLMALGHACMVWERCFLLGLALVALGNGGFKPSVSSQVRSTSGHSLAVCVNPFDLCLCSLLCCVRCFITHPPITTHPISYVYIYMCVCVSILSSPLLQVSDLYPEHSPFRERGFAIFYSGINLGALLAPILCGGLASRSSYHAAFGLAGVGMLIGLGTYLLGWRYLPPPRAGAYLRRDTKPALCGAAGGAGGAAPMGFRRWASLLLLCLLTVPFWAVYAQLGNTLVLFLRDHTQRAPWPGGAPIPVAWLQSLNPCLCLFALPPLSAHWARRAARRAEPAPTRKMALGCTLLAAAYALLGIAAAAAGSAPTHPRDKLPLPSTVRRSWRRYVPIAE